MFFLLLLHISFFFIFLKTLEKFFSVLNSSSELLFTSFRKFYTRFLRAAIINFVPFFFLSFLPKITFRNILFFLELLYLLEICYLFYKCSYCVVLNIELHRSTMYGVLFFLISKDIFHKQSCSYFNFSRDSNRGLSNYQSNTLTTCLSFAVSILRTSI